MPTTPRLTRWTVLPPTPSDALLHTTPITSLLATVAELTGFSRQTATRMFEHKPGVLIMGRAEELHKRGYPSLRIPRFVYERVIERIRVD